MILVSVLSLLLLAQADPGYDAILSDVGTVPSAELCARVEAWVSGHPEDPNAGRALVWLGQQYLTDNRRDDAERAYLRAREGHRGTQWELAGTKGLADLALASRRYGTAISLYRELSNRREPLWNYLGAQGLTEASHRRTLFFIFAALAALLVLWNAGRLAVVKAPLRPLPQETLYLLPVSALLSLAALAQPEEEARAVLTVALGGLLLVHLTGTYLRARPPMGLAARARETLVGLLQTAALLYCAIVWSGLWQKTVDTIAMGPG